METKIKRRRFGVYIEITGLATAPEGISIFEDVEELCCQGLSTNELREVVQQVGLQLKSMDPDDMPPSFPYLFQKVRAVLAARQDELVSPPPVDDAPGYLGKDLGDHWR